MLRTCLGALLIIAISLINLSACGFKSDLYLPQEENSAAPANQVYLVTHNIYHNPAE